MAGSSVTPSTFMASKKTFSDVLTSPSPKPSTKPSQWEKYLLDQINHLQQSNQELHNELKKAKQHIEQLEEQIDIKVKQAAITSDTQSNQVSPLTPQPHMVQAVISEINERDAQSWVKKEIRVGGLTEGWQEVEVLEDEEIEQDLYVPEHEILERKMKRAIPFVDIGEPTITITGKHVVLRYSNLQDKIKVMKQTRSLQGTKVWMADELTPLQLKSKKQELAKVQEARKQGKWAVYRYGKALIEEFRTPKVDKG